MSNSEQSGNEILIEECPDGHHCENGGKCVENPYQERKYYCDCDEAIWDVAYEGLRCEHKQTMSCLKIEGISSERTFCTNDGTCLAFVGADEAHQGCKCTEGYEGTYCQFVSGTKPENWPYTPIYTSDDGRLPGNPQKSNSNTAVLAGFLVVIVGMVIVASLRYAKRYRYRSTGGDDGINDLGFGISAPTTTSRGDRDMYLESHGAMSQPAVEMNDIISPTSVVNSTDDSFKGVDMNKERDIDII